MPKCFFRFAEETVESHLELPQQFESWWGEAPTELHWIFLMESNGGNMHKCVRCGRAATSLQEINDGCPCGSKVFVFNKDALGGDASIAGEEIAIKQINPGSPAAQPAEESGAGGARAPAELQGEGGNGKMPESYHARMAFTSEDVENIKVLTEGVFSLSLQSLAKDPVVLKDEEGIYYVKIPFVQNESALKKIADDLGGDGGDWK